MAAHRKRRRGWRGAMPTGFKPGTAPGMLSADPEAAPTTLHMVAYGPDGILERDPVVLEEVERARAKYPVVWLNVDGLGDIQRIRAIGEKFGLHRLAVEDVVNTGQRAKVERYDDHVFVVAPMTSHEERVSFEQLSLFVGKGWILTFQEKKGDCFDPVRERIRGGRGRIRSVGADYLAYALLDAVIDAQFPVVEKLGDRLEALEEEVLADPERSTVTKIQHVRNDLLGLRRAAWPLRDALSSLLRGEEPVFDAETIVYLRDCHDHVVRVLDLVETYREVGAGLMDMYLSQLSHRMNEVMKVLTIIATIFMPLAFIAGVYGMNFDMPEFHHRWGYPAALVLMAVVGLGMLAWFRKKGWL